MEINKSSRHQAIIGHFGEYLICNWLSRSGWEVTLVDHTGIDIVAYNPNSKQRVGITVKSRTRVPGREGDSVNVFFGHDAAEGHKKIHDACQAFGCEPWLGIYVETLGAADLYLLPMEVYKQRYRSI